MAGPVHYEIYIRKTPPASWTLSMATEERKKAVEVAEDMLRDGQACAVRVTKETLDPPWVIQLADHKSFYLVLG